MQDLAFLTQSAAYISRARPEILTESGNSRNRSRLVERLTMPGLVKLNDRRIQSARRLSERVSWVKLKDGASMVLP
jgi:hypothetical protein